MGVRAILDYVLPSAAFGTCFVCRTADSDQYALLDGEIWEGDVVVCRECAATFSDFAGFVPRRKYDEAVQDAAELREYVLKLEEKAHKYDALMREVADASSRGSAGEPEAAAESPKGPPARAAKSKSKGSGPKNKARAS